MPWTPQVISLEIEIMDVLRQLPVEAVIEYLKSLGYNVQK
jgi:hypothetical protein